MRKQEQKRQAELAAEKAHFEAIQAHADIVSSHLIGIVCITEILKTFCIFC